MASEMASVLSEMVSGLELEIASEMASVRSEMVAGIVWELELEKASGMRSEGKLIDWVRLF